MRLLCFMSIFVFKLIPKYGQSYGDCKLLEVEEADLLNGYVSTAYWEIGQMLYERKIESGYGDCVV